MTDGAGVAIGSVFRRILQSPDSSRAELHRALGDETQLIAGFPVPGLGGARHDLAAPLLQRSHQAPVLGLCGLPDDDVEIGFSHLNYSCARVAMKRPISRSAR